MLFVEQIMGFLGELILQLVRTEEKLKESPLSPPQSSARSSARVSGMHPSGQFVASIRNSLMSSGISTPKGDPYVSASFSEAKLEEHAMEWKGNLDDYPMRTFSIDIKDRTKLLINPVVFGLVTILLWYVFTYLFLFLICIDRLIEGKH